MKTKSLGACCGMLFLFLSANSQNWEMLGLVSYGGTNGGGTILSTNSDGVFNVEFSFSDSTGKGYTPYGNLVQASDGKFYGVCLSGGEYGSCTIFSWDTLYKTCVDVYDFDYLEGSVPSSSVMEAGNGALYGTTYTGGLYGLGVLYRYVISADQYSVIHDFGDSSGYSFEAPYGTPLLHSNGKLYGTTFNRMSAFSTLDQFGAIFSFDINTNIYSEVYRFDSIHGTNSLSSLLESNGLLYGMTNTGGANGAGVIFSFNPVTNTYFDLHDFNTIDGAEPHDGGMMKAKNGLLYGMTYEGGIHSAGVIFSFNPSSNVYIKLHDFDGANGANPMGELNELNGILYGTSFNGGPNDDGVIFSFDPINNIFTVLLNLDGSTYGSGFNGGMITVDKNATSINAPSVADVQLNVYPNPVIEFADCNLQLKKDATVQL